MRVVLLREIPEDANLRQQWNGLVARVDQPQVFYTYEWAMAVQRAYHSSLRPLLFLAYDEQDSLCGVVALATDPAGERGSFLCATTGDYCDFVSLPEHKAALVSQVLAQLSTQVTGDLALTNLPADSDTVAAIEQATTQNGYHCFIRTAYECAQISFDRLERGNDGKPLAPGKKRLRRFVKAMAGEGTLQCTHSRNWDAVEPLLPQFLHAHVVRFLEIGRISNLADERRRLFLSELSKLLSETNWLALTRMSVNDRAYAWHYGFQFYDNWFWYQPTFDSSVEKHWPGFCLLTQVIEDAIENPALKRLDLGLGSEAYKAKFANGSRRTLCVSLRRSWLRYWAEIVRYRSATTIAAKPSFEKVLRKLTAKMAALQRRVGRPGLGATCLWMIGRVKSAIASRDEVRFYEITHSDKKFLKSRGTFLKAVLKAVDMNTLADAAMQNSGDNETLIYLLRCAGRLRERTAEGFALVDSEGCFLHFSWMTPSDGLFLSELETKIDAPAPNSVMIFDCWTPPSQRGRGYYAETVTLIAEQARKQGKAPWTFVAARNSSAIQGLEKSGFQRRYSLIRQRALWWQRIKGRAPRFVEASAVGASAGV